MDVNFIRRLHPREGNTFRTADQLSRRSIQTSDLQIGGLSNFLKRDHIYHKPGLGKKGIGEGSSQADEHV
eukprot:1092097-Pyramimonas_sp.AAC.1